MKNEITIEQAMERLKQAMIDEPDYAHVWHCNIAMSVYDELIRNEGKNHEFAHSKGNGSASRFMKICFNAETSNDMLTK